MAGSDVILEGNPASPGRASGRVRIIVESEHTDRMQDKDVLVTRFTNPLFIPAILKASAIVTDEGGLMCHAAIIAREFGIPCVTGTAEATKKLTDGEEVIVDGEKGFVYG